MTSTGQEPRNPEVGAATISVWRRRRDACAPDYSASHADQANGSHSIVDLSQIDPPDQINHDFAASQQAGINAIINLADSSIQGGQPEQGSGVTTFVIQHPEPHTDALAAAPDYSPEARRQTELDPAAAGKRYGLAHFQVLLLIGVLTIQTVLSLRLVWSNTAYIDEATYLWAGHLEIAHWLHGSPVPPFQTWLSGAPAIYPPIGALADAVGGLFGARILSLVFMTGTTILLWNVTCRLFGTRAAFFAALLFAVLGPTQFLGALATYDAMALLLLAGAAWCVVVARDHADSTILLVAGAVLLALANATKYATALFDPVIFVLAALVITQNRGAKPALGRAGYVAASVTALVATLLALGGPLYMAGIMYTTLARASGDNSPIMVLEDAWKWAGVVWVFAWLGVILCLLRGNRGQAILLAVLATAGLLAPLEQARIHTITSLHKHVDFGAWLAAPAAGYALARLSRMGKHRTLSILAAGLITCAVFIPLGTLGSTQAKSLFNGWPNSSSIVAKLRVLTQSYRGNYLAEDYDIPAYYLEGTISGQRWSNTWYFSYDPPGSRRPITGATAYREAILRHYFSLIILDSLATPKTDGQIAADIDRAGGYRIVGVVRFSFGQYTIWAYQSPPQSGQPSGYR